MDTSEQHCRKCDSCDNVFTLNHFRLNATSCRYCSSGAGVPSHLISSKPKTPSVQTQVDIAADQEIEDELKTNSESQLKVETDLQLIENELTKGIGEF